MTSRAICEKALSKDGSAENRRFRKCLIVGLLSDFVVQSTEEFISALRMGSAGDAGWLS